MEKKIKNKIDTRPLYNIIIYVAMTLLSQLIYSVFLNFIVMLQNVE